MVDAAKKYRRNLKQKLYCPHHAKTALLAQFDKLLGNYLEENPSPTMSDLTASFGPEEKMAKVLLWTVPAKEITVYQRQQSRKKALSLGLAVMFILFTLYVYFWKQKPIASTDVVQDIGTVATETTQNE